jgi:N-ethylmaleimide reductase
MKLFKEYNINGLSLKNRIVMAPMTRTRAIDNIPNQLMKTYYSQRAGSGLIITEGTSPSINGLGYPRIPGAYSDEQVSGWKSVTEGVHDKGGKIFVQLMHTGRVSSIENIPKGGEVLAPSAIQLEGEMFTATGMVPHDMPREMNIEDIIFAQQEFVNAAKRLVESGVDGVELHAANGYLLEQFINPNSNIREDEYGGDYKKRVRFVLETAKLVANEIGADKVGIRFSPYGAYNGMTSDYPELEATYTYLAQELNKMGISYIHLVDQRVAMGAPEFPTDVNRLIRNHFKRTLIVGGDINTAEKGEALINDGYDLVYIGRPFISNPNLVEKLKEGSELVQPDFDTFYSAEAKGYITYN